MVFKAAVMLLRSAYVSCQSVALHQPIYQRTVRMPAALKLMESSNAPKLDPLNVTNGCLTIRAQQW
jgi:hypothetical protein